MNRTPLWMTLSLVIGGGCARDSAGTFIGNPNLTSSYEATDRRKPTRGSLEVSGVAVEPCDGPTEALDAATFPLVAGLSDVTVQLPAGEICTVLLPVTSLSIGFEDADLGAVEIRASDVDILVDTTFTAQAGDLWTIQLGPDDWLDQLAEEAEPGLNELSGASERLEAAFASGLDVSQPKLLSRARSLDLPGRLDLSTFSSSPRGTDTQVDSCAANTEFDLAVPIPPAAMVTRGSRSIGWCEGSVSFGADLALREATGIDYSDLSTFPIAYNGWSQGCGGVHCGTLFIEGSETGQPNACTVLASCDGGTGSGRVTGFTW